MPLMSCHACKTYFQPCTFLLRQTQETQLDTKIAALVQVSEGKLAVMGALGAGLLVGTALSVIIPEGFHAFQSAQHEPGMSL